MKRLQVSCEKGNLAVIREFVKSQLDDFKITGKTSNQIVLAVDEACANSMIHHHHCDGKSHIEVRIKEDQGKLIIEIKDSGKAFPMHKYKPRKVEEIIKMRAKGGLGIMLIHHIMDEVAVEQRKGYCIYKFTKNIR